MLAVTLAVILLATSAWAGAAEKTTWAGTAEKTEDTAALVRSLGPHVERIRGLRFKRPVTVQVVDEAAAREHFKRRAERLWPEEQVKHDQAAYVNLGLITRGTDLMGELLDLLEERVLGYYDPGSDTFFLIEGVSPDAAALVIVHELTHALDDQHFGIDALIEKLRDDDDASTALGAVVEGSGMLVMSAYALEEMQSGRLKPDVLLKLQQKEGQQAARLRALPSFFQRSLAAPYALGATFLLRGDMSRLARGVVAADINRAFRHPPSSSEQILHPRKYWDKSALDEDEDEQGGFTLPDLSAMLGKGWSLADQGSLGELMLALFVGASDPDLTSPEAARPGAWTVPAATGLVRDRYHHYVNGPRNVTVLAAAWDDAAEAQEFQAALRDAPGRRSYRYGAGVLIVGGDREVPDESLASAALGAVNQAASR